MKSGRSRALLLTLPFVLALYASPSAAQAPQLDRVEELVRGGRADEARDQLQEWWESGRGDATRADLQRGLWLRGRLTVDPSQADLEYQRLVVLYPNGPYTAQALLRLAQSAHVAGDEGRARRYVETIRRDYPSSPTRTEADAWLRDAGPAGSPSVAASAPRTATDPPAASTARTVPTTPTTGPPGTMEWMVQFGAFGDQGRASELFDQLVEQGVAARLVRVTGSGFIHVRIGRFATRAEASMQLEQLEARGIEAAIVRDDRSETPIRR